MFPPGSKADKKGARHGRAPRDYSIVAKGFFTKTPPQ